MIWRCNIGRCRRIRFGRVVRFPYRNRWFICWRCVVGWSPILKNYDPWIADAMHEADVGGSHAPEPRQESAS